MPTGRIVKDVVQRITERTKVPNTYQLGEVCQIFAKDNLELRGKGGCWGMVARVNDFSCTVKSWDGEYTVALQHLKSYNYLPSMSRCGRYAIASIWCIRVCWKSVTARPVVDISRRGSPLPSELILSLIAESRADVGYCNELLPSLTALEVDLKWQLLHSSYRVELEQSLGRQAFLLWEADITTFESAIAVVLRPFEN